MVYSHIHFSIYICLPKCKYTISVVLEIPVCHWVCHEHLPRALHGPLPVLGDGWLVHLWFYGEHRHLFRLLLLGPFFQSNTIFFLVHGASSFSLPLAGVCVLGKSPWTRWAQHAPRDGWEQGGGSLAPSSGKIPTPTPSVKLKLFHERELKFSSRVRGCRYWGRYPAQPGQCANWYYIFISFSFVDPLIF